MKIYPFIFLFILSLSTKNALGKNPLSTIGGHLTGSTEGGITPLEETAGGLKDREINQLTNELILLNTMLDNNKMNLTITPNELLKTRRVYQRIYDQVFVCSGAVSINAAIALPDSFKSFNPLDIAKKLAQNLQRTLNTLDRCDHLARLEYELQKTLRKLSRI